MKKFVTATTSPNSDGQPLRCVHYLDAVREERGGVVRAVLDLVDGLAGAGVEVTLLTGDASDVPTDWRNGVAGAPRVVTIQRAMTPFWRIGAADRPEVDEVLAGADVLHLHTPWDPYNIALASAAWRTGLACVVSAHGMLDDWSMAQSAMKKRVFLALCGRRMLHRAFALHLTAEAEAHQALRYAPRADSSVLPLVLDLSPYANLPGPEAARAEFPEIASDAPKLLFLSRVHPKKGVERLIEATANLHRNHRPVESFIAGPGEPDYLKQLQHRALQLGVGDYVHFLGMVRGETKLSLYQACDLFVLPTSQENFGIVLAEAMVCGLPTITTQGVDIAPELKRFGAEIVSDLATPGEQELTAAIAGLLDDPSSQESTASARAGVLEWLDPQRVIEGYIELYRNASHFGTRGVR